MDKSLHICLNPHPLNRAILRERLAIPTPSDVQAQLSGKLVFTIIDMQSAFCHVRLSDSSSYLTTFHNPWRRKRFLSMPFGLSSASEIMQKCNEEPFGDISGVHIIADGLIIAAANPQEHDHIMRLVLTWAWEKRKDKMQFKIDSVQYMGHIVSAQGLKPDPHKVQAITNMPPPHNVPLIQRLLGMTKYLSQYIQTNLSSLLPFGLS